MNIENLTYNIMLDEILDHNDPVFRHLYEVYNLYNKNYVVKPYENVNSYFSYVFLGNFLYIKHKRIMLRDVYAVKLPVGREFYFSFESPDFVEICGKVKYIDSFLKKIKIMTGERKIFEARFQRSIEVLNEVK